MNKITLNTGFEIPLIGYGPGIMGYHTNQLNSSSKLYTFCNRVYRRFYKTSQLKCDFTYKISHAIRSGYRLIDYSASYGNEELIGRAILKSGIPREKLFLTTRVSNRQQLIGNIKEQFFNTLRLYGTDYMDLYMFHWPVTDYYLDTWRQMIELYEKGYCRSLGVANCHPHHLDALIKKYGIIPSVNQVEIHPLFTQVELIQYCKDHGIVVESYTPIARFDDRLMRLPMLKSLAVRHHKTIVQIVLRWHVQKGLIPLTRSMSKQRQLENLSIFDFELTPEEILKIDQVNINSRLRYDPDNCDFSIL